MKPRCLIRPLALALVTLFVLILRLLGFKTLHRLIRSWPTLGECGAEATQALVTRISDAIERATPLFVLRTFCLARSAATACLLRLYGVKANVVIGVRRFPFSAHAWVEVNGAMVRDPYDLLEGYVVMERI